MLTESQPEKGLQPLLFLIRSLRVWELTPTSPKLGPTGSHPASDNAPCSCDRLETTNPNPPPGSESQTLAPRPLTQPAASSPHPHYSEFYSQVGLGPTSCALSRESSKCTLVRLSFPHRSPWPPLRTWPRPKLPRKPIPPPPRPSPGSPPPGATKNTQSLTAEALC